jgi:hypothetical protein
MTGATVGLVISVKGDNNMDSVDKLMPEEEENLRVVSFYADGYGIYVSFTNSKNTWAGTWFKSYLVYKPVSVTLLSTGDVSVDGSFTYMP